MRCLPLLFCACLLSWCCSSVVAEEQQRSSVLFLAVDDLKDWVGCLKGYGGHVVTPHLDALAAEGMLFTNAHCPSPKCAPSRAAILTGLMPSTTGLYDNGHWWYPNLPGVQTLPMHFRNHGYQVVGAGKIFHHTAGNNPPNQWDDFFDLTFRNDPWFRDSANNYPWSKSGPFPEEYPFSGVSGLGHENDWGSLPIEESEYDDVLSANYAIDFLKQKHGRPFFLACGLFRPHLPWYVPQRFFDMYEDSEIVSPEILKGDLKDIPQVGLDLSEKGRKDLQQIRKQGKLKEAIHAYLASISFTDEQVGRILKALRESDAADSTIVVIWSDHGWHLGEKEHWHKSTLWEEATRVPFIIAAPGNQPGECRQPVSLIDIFPTLNDLCQLPAIQNLDGQSLVPLLANPQQPWERPAVIEFQKGNAAIRSERYRYIRYHDGGEELYDHQSDPNEWHNLAKDANYAAVKQELAKSLPETWAEEAPTKKAFEFDPDTFSWKVRSTGQVIHGN